MQKTQVGLFYGGRSVEHDVSIRSATSIFQTLHRERYEVSLIAVDREGTFHWGGKEGNLIQGFDGPEIAFHPGTPTEAPLRVSGSNLPIALDVAFPIIHGAGGEDGSLQGLLEICQLPCVGSSVLGSAIQMDKDVTKKLLHAAGIPVVPWKLVRQSEFQVEGASLLDPIPEELGLPLFVKPSTLGSSVGIQKVTQTGELHDAVIAAFQFDPKVLIEKSVSGREIEVAVLGNEIPQASLPGEIRSRHDFYDYEAKYEDDSTELIIPAELSSRETEALQNAALQAFRVLEGTGLARVDFFLEDNGQFAINEVNSLPGFTSVSMYPLLWEASGISYPALLDQLIQLAIAEYEVRKKCKVRPD